MKTIRLLFILCAALAAPLSGFCQLPSIVSSPSNVTACSGAQATFSVTANNAVSYQWQVRIPNTISFVNVINGTVYSGTTTSTLTILNATSGMNGYRFQCVVTGSPSTQTATSNSGLLSISSPPTSAVISANGPTTFCSPGTVTLTGNTGGLGAWNTGSTGPTLTVLQSGTFFVTRTNTCGTATSNSITVTVNPQPVASIISASGSTNICGSGSVTLSGNSGGVWSNASTAASISVSSNGTFFVTNSNTCGSVTSNTISVSVTSVPAQPQVNTPVSYCQNDVASPLSATGSNLRWYTVPTGGTASTTAITPSTAAAGTFTYYVASSNLGCESARVPISVVIKPKPADPTIQLAQGSENPFCFGSSVTITANPTTSISWSTGATTASINLQTTQQVTLTYVSPTNGCTSSATFNAQRKPQLVAVISGALTGCGPSTTLTATEVVGYPVAVTYEWIQPNNQTAYGLSQVFSTNGLYQLNVYAADACPFAQTSATVNLIPVSVPTIAGPSELCPNTSVTLQSSGTGLVWSTNATTQSISVSSGGTYTVSAQSNGCTVTSSPFVLTALSNPVAPVISASGSLTLCPGQTVTLSGNSNGVWSTSSTAASITVGTQGSYSVTVSNSCGSSVSNSLSVTQASNPVQPQISGASSFCPGSSTTLVASNGQQGITYNWTSGPQDNASYAINAGGPYTVTAVNASGCSSSNSVVVAPCVVLPTTQLRASDCGKMNLSMVGQVACVPVTGASSYEFRILDANNNLYATRTSTATTLSGGSVIPNLQYGQTYKITVRVRIGNVFGAYGQECLIGMMPAPTPGNIGTTMLRPAFCNTTLPLNTTVSYNGVSMVSQYQAQFVPAVGGNPILFSTGLNNFALSAVSGLVVGQTYSVSIRARVDNVWGNYGTACNVTIAAPSGARMAEANESGELLLEASEVAEAKELRMSLYPNPAHRQVNLLLESPEAGRHQWEMFDLSGRKVLMGQAVHAQLQIVPLDELPRGVYFLRVASPLGSVITQKLILE